MSKKDIFTKKNITSEGKNAIFYGDISRKYDCFAQEIINRIDDDIYSEFLLYDENGNLIEETSVTSFESREIINLLIKEYEAQLLKVGGKIRKAKK